MGTITKFKNWQYKNTAFLVLTLIIFFLVFNIELVQNLINEIGNWGYAGAILVGIFFVSIFTVVPATVVLYNLAEKLNPFEIAILAGIGAVIGDYLIFKFLKDRVFEELKPLFIKFKWSIFLKNIFSTPYFSWLLPLVGAIVIASPFPDELGISVLGISKVKNWQFILLTFLLNAVGIFIIVTIARAF